MLIRLRSPLFIYSRGCLKAMILLQVSDSNVFICTDSLPELSCSVCRKFFICKDRSLYPSLCSISTLIHLLCIRHFFMFFNWLYFYFSRTSRVFSTSVSRKRVVDTLYLLFMCLKSLVYWFFLCQGRSRLNAYLDLSQSYTVRYHVNIQKSPRSDYCTATNIKNTSVNPFAIFIH